MKDRDKGVPTQCKNGVFYPNSYLRSSLIGFLSIDSVQDRLIFKVTVVEEKPALTRLIHSWQRLAASGALLSHRPSLDGE